MTEIFWSAWDCDMSPEQAGGDPDGAVILPRVEPDQASRIDPCLENLRGHPSFARLMDRVREEWERLEN